MRLDDGDSSERMEREIAAIRESGALGKSSKLRDLFDYLVERSRTGTPPREIEIAQDVFGRVGQTSDDGAGRVYIHRLRRRLEEIYRDRPATELRIMLPLGEYRLVAEVVAQDAASAAPLPSIPPETPPQVGRSRLRRWPLAAAAIAGSLLTLLAVVLLAPAPVRGWRDAARARASAVWAPLFGNGRSIVVAAGDSYLFEERGTDGAAKRLIRDLRLHSREDLDRWLIANPALAGNYADAGLGYVPTTLPRAQLFLAPILLAAPSVRTLPVSQLPAAAMLSQNIVYLGLTSGLGPLRGPVSSGARFEPDADLDAIHDRRTGRTYSGGPSHGGDGALTRQYGLLSMFAGKEGNRYIVLAGTSDMGLVGLAETVADPVRMRELAKAAATTDTVEALYQIDSQGAGVLAVRLIGANRRDPARIWTP